MKGTRLRAVVVAVAGALTASAFGCGSGGETTTIIRETTVEAPPPKEQRQVQRESRPTSAHKEPPNVIDLPLDVAEELLEDAGYRVAATNTDTTFGIVVPSNYTVCTQDDPRGQIVPVLAQKYGC